MKYCTSCGKQIDNNAMFCPECGAQQAAQAPNGAYGQSAGQPFGSAPQYNNAYGNPYGQQDAGQGQPFGQPFDQQAFRGPQQAFAPVVGKERSIVLCVILSLVTLGIYGIYWMICLNEDINAMSMEPKPVSGVMVVIFTMITCGIYGLYWMYKMGNGVDRIKGSDGNSGILYLVLAVFGLAIIPYVLMQDTINKAVNPAG